MRNKKMKQIDRYQVSCFQEIFVDLFAGGRGADPGKLPGVVRCYHREYGTVS